MNRANRLAWTEAVEGSGSPGGPAELEVACVVTEGDLTLVAEGPVAIVRPGEDASAAEEGLVTFLREHCPEGKVPLSGDEAAQVRAVLRRRMPRVDAFLHYRVVDVSTVRALVAAWLPDAYATRPGGPVPASARARVQAAVNELRHYRAHAFR